jgi:hypothetical protein
MGVRASLIFRAGTFMTTTNLSVEDVQADSSGAFNGEEINKKGHNRAGLLF